MWYIEGNKEAIKGRGCPVTRGIISKNGEIFFLFLP